ncbi:TetR/AcrR family transcriptional regulator [Sinosporangium siamense]|uniref:TetR family transcriptional regulator n=1 Tax=Sinosporangium siamense TaxID=1367973 RepID=A0A919RN25_9ACTN|nr:TetR/AcrR family transcriptional regulator [Sinosporangium siamense]GII95019.1 TetR family transcriptional regulator [Sinosporangium siamense]
MEKQRRGRPPLVGRREEILDAAVRVLADRGIETMSLAQLSEALGFSTYALTYHFGAKEQLLAAVAEHIESVVQLTFAALADQPGLTLAELMRRYWEINREPGSAAAMRLWLDLVLLASRAPERLPGFLQRAVFDWRAVIAGALGDRPDAERLTTLVFATITGLELMQLIEPESDAPRQALEAFIGLLPEQD